MALRFGSGVEIGQPDSKLFLDFQIDLQIQKKFTEKTALLKSWFLKI